MSVTPRKTMRWRRWLVIVLGPVLIAVAGVLVLLCTGYTQSGLREDPDGRAAMEVHAIAAALESYHADYGTYPMGDSGDAFRRLTGKVGDTKVYIEWPEKQTAANGGFLDPWGTPYRYAMIDEVYTIRSAGKNRKFEPESGSDDVATD